MKAYQIEDKAKERESSAEKLRSDYLRQRGWVYHSSTPSCFWMWCKEWQGKQWSYFGAKEALKAEGWMASIGATQAARPND